MDALSAVGVQPQTTEPGTGAALDGGTADAQGPLTFQSLLTQLKLALPSKPGLPTPTTDEMVTEQRTETDLTPSAQPTALDALPIESLLPSLPAALFQPLARDPQTSAGEPALKQPAIGEPDSKRAKEMPAVAALTEVGKSTQRNNESGPAAKPAEAANFAVPASTLPPAASDAPKNIHDAPDANLASALTVATPMPQAVAATPMPQTIAAIPMPPAVAAIAGREAPAATAQLAAEVGSPTWGNELGQRLVLMVGAKQHVAELHLNPPHLGPIDVTLTIDGSQTSAVFTSPHSAVREVISAEMPRLREILADSGITLGNASVTADTPRDSAAYASAQQSQRGASRDGAAANVGSALDAGDPITRRIGLVDIFA